MTKLPEDGRVVPKRVRSDKSLMLPTLYVYLVDLLKRLGD